MLRDVDVCCWCVAVQERQGVTSAGQGDYGQVPGREEGENYTKRDEKSEKPSYAKTAFVHQRIQWRGLKGRFLGTCVLFHAMPKQNKR